MARKPKPEQALPQLQAAHLLSYELHAELMKLAQARPLIAEDTVALTIAVADVALSVLLGDERYRNSEQVDRLADYIGRQGRDILASIEKNGLRNPPHGPGFTR